MKRPSRNLIFGGILILAVATSIVVGVILLGPPSEWRGRRLDEHRTSDLRELSFAIEEYYASVRSLPESLDALAMDSPWIAELSDPETGNPYQYHMIDPSTYELCADFALRAGTSARDRPYARSTWDHPSGEYCFRLTAIRQID